jgi:hypothetical protein
MLNDDTFSEEQHRLEVKDEPWRLAWFVKVLAFAITRRMGLDKWLVM